MIRFIIALATIVALFSVSKAAPATIATTQQLAKRRPVGFNITSIQNKGKGCPAKTLGVSMSNDLANLTFLYSSMYATGGPGVENDIKQKGCQVSLKMALPKGYAFGIETITYRGWYRLDDGVKAVHSSAYSFSGYSYHVSTARSVYQGPMGGEYYGVHSSYNYTEHTRSPCGSETITETTFYAVDLIFVDNSQNANGWGFIGNNNVSSQLSQVYGFKWYEC
ncbi:hypothetical protein FRC19_005168 [Serendipita sp. 401]|nr:hypothetical protein FRC19_005168 [Serendipita sp. 401]